MFHSVDLFGWQQHLIAAEEFIQPWKPIALDHGNWPPNYRAVYAWRMKTLAALRSNADLLASAKAYYTTHRKEFIMHWMDTYDPRKPAGQKWVPFVFFARQAEFIDFLDQLRTDQQSGLVEKARDMGATWLACGYSVASWLFIQDDAIGWGSRKQELVDKLGDPDSIFEKMRLIIGRLPNVFRPRGLDAKKHLTFMKCINPENGATITGESGDNIGRGGRKSIYFKDESAHYERPEKIEAALGDNTNVQIDISSVNGVGNPFYRRRKAGVLWTPDGAYEPGFTRIFVIDWRDHPDKTQEWYDTKKSKYEREGMAHIFAQEVDRNYSAALSNTVIPSAYIDAAIDAHLKIPVLRVPPSNAWWGGLDIADGGIDRNALALRQTIILRSVEEWGERDTGVSTRRAIVAARMHPNMRMMYDAIGVGAGVKSEYNRLVTDEKIVGIPQFTPWNAGAQVLDPYERLIPDDDNSLLNIDFFENLKAQAWWALYIRFYKTFKCIEAIKNEQPIPNYKAEELISIDSNIPLLHQLTDELAQPVRKQSAKSLKMMIDKAPDGLKSPNLADSICMCYYPVPDDYSTVLVGAYG